MSTSPLWALPEQYMLVPMTMDDPSACLQIGIVVRREPEPVAGHFIALRDTADARVLLGAVVDHAGHLHEWVEVTIQDVARLHDSIDAGVTGITNQLLEARWKRYIRAADEVGSARLLYTGWEEQYPLPALIDLAERRMVHPESDKGTRWSLCTDDRLLEGAGLPTFTGSLHRYLTAPGEAGPDFIAVTPDAPRTEQTRTLAEFLPKDASIVPLNPCCGLMMVRPCPSASLAGYLDLLAGETTEELRHGRTPLSLGNPDAAEKGTIEEELLGDGWLFQGMHGKWGRLVETFHLKLHLVRAVISAACETVRRTQTPLLNLSAESFGVELAAGGTGMPRFWSARATLREPGDAVPLQIVGSDVRTFARLGVTESSVYEPASVTSAVKGRATLRLREFVREDEQACILEGTILTQERVEANRNDLLAIRVSVRDHHVRLYGRLETDDALASGEQRFRTIEQRLSEADRTALRGATGVPLQNVGFELIPLQSTPHDLYALFVLATQILLVNPQLSLPVAVDEMLSLARQMGLEYEESMEQRERMEAIFDRDPRWVETLGPHRLSREPVSAADGIDLVPLELWQEVLGVLVSMVPGAGRDSLCRDFADAPAAGLQRLFEPALERLDGLLLRTRSLLVIDWRFNREIHAVIRQQAMAFQGANSGMMD